MYDTSGMGAYKWGGRWNFPGIACLYTSTHISLAILEKLVHAQQIKDMKDIALMTLEIAQPKTLYQIDSQKLKENWQDDYKYCQWLGSQVLNHPGFIGFKAPSVIVPGEWNIILQPNARQTGGITLMDSSLFQFDVRLTRIVH